MRSDGLIFKPGPSPRCDDLKVGVAVPRIDPKTGDTLLWYCCRDQSFDPGIMPSILTARVGMARSKDGVLFDRVDGPEQLGSVFGPSADVADFDGETVGVIDITRVGDEWWMWYLGTNAEPRLTDYGMIRGAGHLPGLARSGDGVHWTRVRGEGPGGALLPYVGDNLFTSWPNAFYSESRFWLYVTVTNRSITLFDTHYATSEDGVAWTYQGPMPWRDGFRDWDSGGIMTRSVQANPCSFGKAWPDAVHGARRPSRHAKASVDRRGDIGRSR